MKSVKIATLKARLSSYLREVQNGEPLVVTDRQTPIARVVPYTAVPERIQILEAKGHPKHLKYLKIPSPSGSVDSLRALLEDRGDDLEE